MTAFLRPRGGKKNVMLRAKTCPPPWLNSYARAWLYELYPCISVIYIVSLYSCIEYCTSVFLYPCIPVFPIFPSDQFCNWIDLTRIKSPETKDWSNLNVKPKHHNYVHWLHIWFKSFFTPGNRKIQGVSYNIDFDNFLSLDLWTPPPPLH